MKVTAIILGILGGLLFLLFALVGHSLGGIYSFGGNPQAASTIKLVSWGLPILALVGAGLVTVQPVVAAVLLAVPAVALVWMFGLGFFTLIPVVLLGVAALLAFMSTMESGKKTVGTQ